MTLYNEWVMISGIENAQRALASQQVRFSKVAF